MSDNATPDRIQKFADECAAAGVAPEAVLVEAGLHRSVWFRWKSGEVSPTMRSWDAALSALEDAKRRRTAA